MKTPRRKAAPPPDYRDLSPEPTAEHTADKKCRQCRKVFYFKPAADPQPDFCSIKCARKWHENEKRAARERETRAIMAATVYDNPLTPQETAQIRNRVATHVKDHIEIAARVISGEPGPDGKVVKWTPVQARLFNTFLNKVLPDLNQSHVKHEHRNVDLTELSREELEALAAGSSSLASRKPDDIIDVTPEPVSSEPSDEES